MGQSKRDYMETYDPLASRYEEQIIYETLCDTRSKDIE